MKIRFLTFLAFFTHLFASSGGDVSPDLPVSKYWRHDSTTGCTTVSAQLPAWNLEGDSGTFGPLTLRSMAPADDERVVVILSDPRVREKFASLPKPEDLPGRCETFYRAKKKTTPPQAGIVLEIGGDGEKTIVGFARLGQQLPPGTTVPALLLDPAYWGKGITRNLLNSSVVAKVLAEAYMIGSKQMTVDGTPDGAFLDEQFYFCGAPLTRHGATAHPENASFALLAKLFPAAPVPTGTAVIELPEEGWIAALNARFSAEAEEPLEKDKLYTIRITRDEGEPTTLTMSWVTEMFGQRFDALRGHFVDPVDTHVRRSGLAPSLQEYVESRLKSEGGEL